MKTKRSQSIRSFFPAVLILLFLCPLPAWAGGDEEASWPQWRGPNRDGISTETDWNPAALSGGPKLLWHVNIGMGHSNVAIKDCRLYTMGRNKDGECVLALDAGTGEEIWASEIGYGIYPQSTPVVDGRHIYALSEDGVVACFKAQSGDSVWSRNLANEFGAPIPKYGYGTSPCASGNLVLLNTKTSGIALRKATGELVWEGGACVDKIGKYYATPVTYSHRGREHALIFSFTGLYSMDVKSGERLWFYEWTKQGSPNAADPVLFDGRVFISSSETDSRGAVLDIGGDEPQLLWETPEMANHFSSAVYLDGYLYGVHGDYHLGIKRCTLRCLDAETGTLMWEEHTGGASLSAADGKLIVLTAKGTLHIVEAAPEAYGEISSCELPTESGKHMWWTPPVLCGGRIYCRNFSGDLVCIDVSE